MPRENINGSQIDEESFLKKSVDCKNCIFGESWYLSSLPPFFDQRNEKIIIKS